VAGLAVELVTDGKFHRRPSSMGDCRTWRQSAAITFILRRGADGNDGSPPEGFPWSLATNLGKKAPGGKLKMVKVFPPGARAGGYDRPAWALARRSGAQSFKA
jgi:hypothetical protein